MSTGTEPRRLGRYELQQQLGRGGMAEVWKALDTQLQRYVAIKILHPDLRADPSFAARFEREAQLIAALHHPNIVQIYDFQMAGSLTTGGLEEPAAYMIMDYVEGETLAQYLYETVKQGHMLPAQELLQLFTPICHAIDYAHQRGMVHRDLKPANILLDARNRANNPAGEPIISDFGISKMLNDQTQTQHGFWLGTPAYIAPEQVQGERTTAQSDIYALAIILYETCTGTLPFQADGPIALAMQHVNGTPTPPNLINPHMSNALSDVIMQGLAKDPSQRFTTATALLDALKQAQQTQQASQAPGLTEEDTMATQVATNEDDVPTYLMSKDPTLTPAQSAALASNLPAQVPPAAPAAPAAPVLAVPLAPQANTPTKPPTTKKRNGRRPLLIGLVVCVLLAALGGGAFLLGSKPAATALEIAGTVNFFNSGQYNRDGSAGITDKVQVDFATLPAPDAGKAYYAWLLSDARQQQQSMLLGTLHAAAGKGQLVYDGDANHSNLLAHYSRFVLTMESASPMPTQIGPKNTWRYYGEIPNVPIASDTISHYSLLDHTRHLVSDDPIMNSIGLHGGLNLWLKRNSEKLLESASNARDEQNLPLLHRQVVRCLDYLDGATFSQVDVPPGTSFLIDPLAGRVGLLTFSQEQAVPGLLSHIRKHMEGLSQAPQATDGQIKLAKQLAQEAQATEQELMQARNDARQLVMMSNDQLGQPAAHTLLNDLYQHINQASVGQRDVATGELKGGVEQISAQILRLATIDVKPYKG
ncbi:MAG: hypothetical protein NVS2B12_21760 [Ktedonobacteraceae bacterium]